MSLGLTLWKQCNSIRLGSPSFLTQLIRLMGSCLRYSLFSILILSSPAQADSPSQASQISSSNPLYTGLQSGLFGMEAYSSVGPFLQTGVSTALSSKASSSQLDGRLSSRSYFSTDSSKTFNSPDVWMSFLETDLRGRNFTSAKISFNLDATFILDVSQANERRFGETERLDQIRQLYLTLPLSSRLKLHFGRRLIREAGNGWVDGVDGQFELKPKTWLLGVYGGLSPDRFDRSLTLDYQAAGTYTDYHSNGFDLSLGYNAILFQGGLDRHFISQRTHYKLADGLFFSDYLIADLIRGGEVTTLLSTLDYTPVSPLNLTINFSRYSLEQYRNQAIYRNIIEPNQALILGNEVVDLVYNRIRFSASVRLFKHIYHYQMVEYKNRAQDGLDSRIYTLGLREENLLGTQIEVDLQAQFADHFRADTLILAATARKNISSVLFMDARLTQFNGRTLDQNTDRLRIFDEAQEIYLFGLSIVGRLQQSHRLSLSYDGVYESELTDRKTDEDNVFIHTGMFKYSYLF